MKHLVLAFSLILSGLTFAQVTETATPAPKVGLKFTTLEIVRENIPYDNKDLFEFEFKNISKRTTLCNECQYAF